VKSIKFTEARLNACGAFVYLCFLPAVAEKVEGEKLFWSCDLWSCDLSFIH